MILIQMTRPLTVHPPEIMSDEERWMEAARIVFPWQRSRHEADEAFEAFKQKSKEHSTNCMALLCKCAIGTNTRGFTLSVVVMHVRERTGMLLGIEKDSSCSAMNGIHSQALRCSIAQHCIAQQSHSIAYRSIASHSIA